MHFATAGSQISTTRIFIESKMDLRNVTHGTEVMGSTIDMSSISFKTPSPTTLKILEILEKYRLHGSERQSKPLNLAEKFIDQIERSTAQHEPVFMVLPAFPFKSANKSTKVLGTLPDKGEEVALKHLNSLCDDIAKVYKHGARLYIVSDGLVYNGT